MSELRSIVDFKKNPVCTVLVMLGLLLIIIGAGINFYNTMFQPEEETQPDTSERRIFEPVVPTDMNALSTKINMELGHFLLYKYNPLIDSGLDLLSDSRKRLDLVNSILEKSGNVSWNEGAIYFPYVSENDYRNKYIEIYGSDANYDIDMQAYNEKEIVDNALGVGFVGWNALWGDATIERTLEAHFVDYDRTLNIYTISGVYKDTQAGVEVSNGTFLINYSSNNTGYYLINITLNHIS